MGSFFPSELNALKTGSEHIRRHRLGLGMVFNVRYIRHMSDIE